MEKLDEIKALVDSASLTWIQAQWKLFWAHVLCDIVVCAVLVTTFYQTTRRDLDVVLKTLEKSISVSTNNNSVHVLPQRTRDDVIDGIIQKMKNEIKE